MLEKNALDPLIFKFHIFSFLVHFDRGVSRVLPL